MSLGSRPGTETPFRICLDANVWVHYLDALTNGRSTAVLQVMQAVQAMQLGPAPLQLVLSLELIDTIERVLLGLEFSEAAVHGLVAAIGDLMQAGPEHLDPPLLLSGRDQLAMSDREDAGVLASCIAARVDLLITDNLRDFVTNDSVRVDTRVVRRRDGSTRQLFALIYERADGVALVVMHPIDAIGWLRAGDAPTPTAVRERYAASGTP